MIIHGCRFDVYWIQTNKQIDKQTDKPNLYIDIPLPKIKFKNNLHRTYSDLFAISWFCKFINWRIWISPPHTHTHPWHTVHKFWIPLISCVHHMKFFYKCVLVLKASSYRLPPRAITGCTFLLYRVCSFLL